MTQDRLAGVLFCFVKLSKRFFKACNVPDRKEKIKVELSLRRLIGLSQNLAGDIYEDPCGIIRSHLEYFNEDVATVLHAAYNACENTGRFVAYYLPLANMGTELGNAMASFANEREAIIR